LYVFEILFEDILVSRVRSASFLPSRGEADERAQAALSSMHEVVTIAGVQGTSQVTTKSFSTAAM
jgi:hypothetical protein